MSVRDNPASYKKKLRSITLPSIVNVLCETSTRDETSADLKSSEYKIYVPNTVYTPTYSIRLNTLYSWRGKGVGKKYPWTLCHCAICNQKYLYGQKILHDIINVPI